MSKIPYNSQLTAVLEVAHLDSAIAWYSDCLGFQLNYKVDEMGWCEMQSPVEGTTVGLSQVEAPGGKGGATLTWGVGDAEAARAALESKGVRFDGPNQVMEGFVILSTFFDPDGNTHMFAQSLQEA